MIKVTLLYPLAAGARFDFDYYAKVHMPETVRRLGAAMRSITVERGVSPGAPWPDAAYAAICTFTCESRQAYEQAFFPHAEYLQADMANYTDITPIVQISDVVIDFPQGAAS